jgi:hypothetical protein
MTTIKQLAERKAKLVADLARINEEIASRSGEEDSVVSPATHTEKPVAKQVSKK